MIGINNFGLFVTLSWILIITPGPDFLYVLTRGISIGRKAGLISAVGVTLGILVHTVFAALGLSMILKTSAAAFMVVKTVGAGYLIYIGIKTLLEKKPIDIHNTETVKSNRILIQGFVSNVFNPKVALFFMAFLPQFVNAQDQASAAIQFMALGLVFAFFTVVFLATLGYFSGWIGQHFTENNSVVKRLQRLSGVIMILLGFRLAFVKQE